jgi:hypothetical protein
VGGIGGVTNAVLLDSGSEVHIFKDKTLLSGLSECTPISLSGINGDAPKLLIHEAGMFRNIPVYYHPKAGGNLLSWCRLEDDFHLRYDPESRTVLVTGGAEDFVFKRSGGHLMLEMQATARVATVRSNEARYSKRELERAKRARNLLECLNYPSAETLINALRHGNLDNPMVSAQDVRVAEDVYGPPVPSLKGKSTKPVTSSTEPMSRERVSGTSTLSIDIMTITGMMWLVGVVDEIGLTYATYLSNKSSANIRDVVVDMLESCQKHGWEVTLRCDNERSFLKAIDLLSTRAQYIRSEVVSPGSHVPIVERKIRTIKERVRAVLSALPYEVPTFFKKWIVNSVVITTNMLTDNSIFSKTGDNRSPRERFTGKRVDVQRHLRLPVGQFVHTYDVNNPNPSSMRPRSLGCICLGSLANDAGTYAFWNIASGSIIHRNSWTVVPISDAVIKTVNEYARSSKTGAEPPLEELLDTASPPVNSRGARQELTQEPTQEPAQEVGREADPVHEDEDPLATEDSQDLSGVPPDSETGTDLDDAPPTIEPSSEPEELSTTQPSNVSAQPEANTHSPYPSRVNRGQPAERYGFHVRMTDAISRLGTKAMDSIITELTNVISYDALDPVMRSSVPRDTRIIRSSLFLKEKVKPDGSFDKLKSRFVAGGHLQDKSKYAKEEISSPTAALSSLLTLSTIAALERREVTTVDITSAYLNATIERPVYMRIEPALAHIAILIKPEWKPFQEPGGAIVVKLRKALYGCVESSALWYQDLSSTMASAGFKTSKIDPCVHYKADGNDMIHVTTHVDDLKIMSTSPRLTEHLIAHLTQRYTHLTVHTGKTHDYLGMSFDYRVEGKVTISMNGYVQEILSNNNVQGISKSPATKSLFDVSPDSPPLQPKEAELFHTNVARLLYLVERIRPDMCTAVAFLTTRVNRCTAEDQGKLDRLLRYLKHTEHLSLTLEADEGVQVKAYVDAAYGVHANFKGHTGGHITLGRGGIVNKSSKQKLVAKSSTEAELIAVSDFMSTVIQVRDFLSEIGYPQRPAIVYQDNQSTMRLIERGRPASERTRHINIRYFFIKERVASKELQIVYCPTNDMVSDILTKPLAGAQLFRLRARLLNLGTANHRGVLEETACSDREA